MTILKAQLQNIVWSPVLQCVTSTHRLGKTKCLELANTDKNQLLHIKSFCHKAQILSISCPHTVVQAARHIYMTGSPYAKENGVRGVTSASSFMHLKSSRTHRRTVVMDSYTWLPSSELFSICLKADVVLRLLKPSQY